ncbi:hypothetical protein B0J14DRAFT_671381 [Halenospora varia]|nr:hypothetical protein B0J14DRAFT_671381 [Halenospora varia]
MDDSIQDDGPPPPKRTTSKQDAALPDDSSSFITELVWELEGQEGCRARYFEQEDKFLHTLTLLCLFLLRNFSHPYQPPKRYRAKKKNHCRVEKGKHKGDKKVKKAHENGDAGICLTRVERNKLRKFLFIMKYRGPGFFDKYFSEDLQAYTSEDKHLLRDYMAEKGFITPRDVWLHNLHAILHLDIDVEGKWTTRLPDLMFPADATMFIVHAQHLYIAFCTPIEKDDEFVLTDQGYNLFEGPTHNTFCVKTGDYIGDTYMCFHEFGPVSPRLIIVLRSNTLPEALEDKDSKIKKARQQILYTAVVVVNNRLKLAPGESGTPQFRDRFTFRFWPISTNHMNIINSIFLDNLLHCNSIVFGSKTPFRQTLEAYINTQAHGLKKIGVGEYGAKTTRLACLEKLTIVLKKLGVKNVLIFCDEIGEGNKPFIRSLDEEWLEVFRRMFEGAEESFASSKAPFWQTYHSLGGTSQTFLKDLEQSWRLYQFQSQIMKWTVGLENSLRKNAFAWMTSKEYAMHQQKYVGTGPIYAAKTAALFKQEIEDFIVEANHATDYGHLCILMYSSVVCSMAE